MTNIFNPTQVRKQFPFLKSRPTPIYLDNAATTQKPQSVLDALTEYYINHNGNVSRGSHRLTRESTNLYNEARKNVARFIQASSSEDIIFTRNTTDSLNLVANLFAAGLKTDDVILLTQAEHHSNLLPWIKLSKETGARIEFIPTDVTGNLVYHDTFQRLKTQPVKLIALPYVSNVFGTVNPVRKIFEQARANWPDIVTVVDAAQAVGKIRVNIDHLKCDFLAFSAHKMYGPMGIGVLYGRHEVLSKFAPPVVGGGMVRDVEWADYTPSRSPTRFEAGTPNVADTVGLRAAIGYINELGIDNISEYELSLTKHLIEQLNTASIPGLRIYGPAEFEITGKPERVGIVSFNVDGIHAEDLANFLDDDQIMVRAGHHCAMPLHQDVLKLDSSLRVSFAVYNTTEEIDSLINSLKRAVILLR
jgi:cysteine desulfurase/selenocysteine lyase